MLNKDRIKEAESNVRSYLAEGLLKKTTEDEQIINILIKNAKDVISNHNIKTYFEQAFTKKDSYVAKNPPCPSGKP